MTELAPNSGQVADYLRAHPDFFTEHLDLLATISVPHPHGGRAISLQERQLELLRERHRALELKLADLLRIGEENDAIGAKLQRWTRDLLLAADPSALPEAVVEGLRSLFVVPQVALRLWNLDERWASLPFAAAVQDDTVRLADSMSQAYCGPNTGFQPASWLDDDGHNTRSIALLPLRKGADPKSFGLIVLGSPDGDRFRDGMGITYLERIAEIASASLSRLTR